MEQPQKGHDWLQQLVGEWTFEGECVQGADQPPISFGGTQSVRSLGGLWILAESQGEMPGGGAATTLISLGFDPGRQRYTGTFIGSMSSYLWHYDGELDEDSRTLPLNAKGPSMNGDGSMANYQDIIEIKSPDLWLLRARVQMPDGSWNEFMETRSRRA